MTQIYEVLSLKEGRPKLISIAIGPAGGLDWHTVSESITMTPQQGYVVDSLSLTLLTLPAIAKQGDKLAVIGSGGAGWRIAQNDDQQIKAGNQLSSIGVSGKLESTDPTDQVELLCLSPQLWVVANCYGNLEIA